MSASEAATDPLLPTEKRNGRSMMIKGALPKTAWSILLPFLMVGLLFPLGCAQRGEKAAGPREVLSSYLDAAINGRYEDAYQRLSSRDKAATTLKAYVGEKGEEESFIHNAIARKISFTVRDMAVQGDKAEARVDIKAPDFERILKSVLSELSSKSLPRGSLDAHRYVSGLLGRQARKYRDEGIPMKTTAEVFHLVKEADGWKMDLHRDAKP